MIYIVLAGERSEGDSVCGVFSDREEAIACALAEKAHFGPWQREGDRDLWTSGCDFVRVDRWTAQDRFEPKVRP